MFELAIFRLACFCRALAPRHHSLIAWIGSSFYFIALDLGLRKAQTYPGAHGEQWQVHGGGFYHIRKFLIAPENSQSG